MKNENNDVWAAIAIGAVVGIGAALIYRGQQEDTTGEMIARRLKPVQKRARKAARTASSELRKGTRSASRAGGEILSAGEDILDELRSGAREIVKSTREELRRAAHESVSEARRAARKARRSLG